MKFANCNQQNSDTSNCQASKYRHRIGNYRLLSIAILALFVFGSVAVYAQKYSATSTSARPQIKVDLSGVVVREGKELNVADAGLVNSGEMLRWTIVSKNEGRADALSHEAIGHIPAGTTFVDDIAAEVPAAISYSIDGGKNFSVQPMIAEQQADGTTKQVPAPVSMYTSVRYYWNTRLAINGERAATYQVRVN